MTRLLSALSCVVFAISCSAPSRPTATTEAVRHAGSEPRRSASPAAAPGPRSASRAIGSRLPRGPAHRRIQERTRREAPQSAKRPVASVAHPLAGTFVYAQEGFEELCRAGVCDRAPLAPHQRAVVRLGGSVGDRVIMTTTAISGDRRLETTTAYGHADALLTRLAFRMDYKGFSFVRSYEPGPPITALKLPYRHGAKWAGRWDARTAGSYRVHVTGPSSLTVNRHEVGAWRVSTLSAFRGELQGNAQVDTWVDGRTHAVLAMRGSMSIRSAFGDYYTEFDTRLIRGPGYR